MACGIFGSLSQQNFQEESHLSSFHFLDKYLEIILRNIQARPQPMPKSKAPTQLQDIHNLPSYIGVFSK